MSVRKYKFVSPGIFLREIDNSQLPADARAIGPVIIGRTEKGPALKPIIVKDMDDFSRVFGLTVPGGGADTNDPWRDGNSTLAPAYVGYAAQAYFAAGNETPLTVVRLLGAQDPQANAATAGAEAGWHAAYVHGVFGTLASSAGNNIQHGVTSGSSIYPLALFYSNDENFDVGLKGTAFHGATAYGTGSQNTGSLFKAAADGTITIGVGSGSGPAYTWKKCTFGSPTDRNYIRRSFNTNAAATNASISHDIENYWLGEVFEGAMVDLVAEKADDEQVVYFTAPLSITGNDDPDMGDLSYPMQAARTGWVIHQDLTHNSDPETGEGSGWDPRTDLKKLFRIHALHEGIQASKELVVQIEDIKIANPAAPDPYSSFTVKVYNAAELCLGLEARETYSLCNLNPNSPKYVARQIGDMYAKWQQSEKRNRFYGENPNRSQLIRVEMHPDVENGQLPDTSVVPFGFWGPSVPHDILLRDTILPGSANDWISGSFSAEQGGFTTEVNSQTLYGTGSLKWPRIPLIVSASNDGGPFGVRVGTNAAGSRGTQVDPGYVDYIRRLPQFYEIAQNQDLGKSWPGAGAKASFVFTLNDIVVSGSNLTTADALVEHAYYKSGSYELGDAFTSTGSAYASHLLELGYDKFAMPLVGGFDGINILEANPFNNSTRTLSGKSSRESYAYASVERAIDTISNPEIVEHNVALMPGITVPGLTKKLVQACEARSDSLAIIDLPNIYVPPTEEKCDAFHERLKTNPKAAAKELVERQLNSSYGCSYYPWVKVADPHQDGKLVWVPPSVVALGVFANTDKRDVWFAPAGFNRGGLTLANCGLQVTRVSEQLLSKDRDALYEAGINPIASFVGEGIVVFGQKTLQLTRSALDRINVRRLLIYVKKEISFYATDILFDQNVKVTWNRFLQRVVPFLEGVKTRLGLSDFKVILDETTTTPDLVDRNVLYAKVFLKPARAIEFIAVDFVITRTGAAWQD